MSVLPGRPTGSAAPATTAPVLVAGDPAAAEHARVAVCIPVYQGGAHLAETLRSVLHQTLRDLEVVVLDNASTDGTAELLASCRDPRVTVWRSPVTVPMVENVRRVVARSRAPFVKILPADDVLHPGCLASQVAALVADPGLAMVVGREDFVDERGRVLVRGRFLRGLVGEFGRDAVVRRVVRSGANPIGTDGSATFRRACYEAAGGYPDEQAHADLELWLALLRHGSFLGTRDTVMRFRVGGHAVSAASHRDDYRAQRILTRAVATAERRVVGRRDVVVGRVSARCARWRRAAVYRVARLTTRGWTRG